MRNAVVLTVATLTVAVFATSAMASVRKVSFTGTISPNHYAALTVKVSPKARCTISVVYDTVESKAKGLTAKTGTTISWRWKVGSSTHAGSWPVKVDCGKSGKLVLHLRVR